ncbi:MAG TPA: PstS family phosphate ABC transporter substrate-binding protein [Acidimicrobiales bacterium]|nr:PstS family phosphate ABC transporter substrate-binding protein [Acidimicrobiales bacterium]
MLFAPHRPVRLLALPLALTLLATACGGGNGAGSGSGSAIGEDLSGDIRIDGSSTVAPLSTVAAELFQDEHPDVRVTVGTSGTGGGFEKFCNGETDISDASRAIKDDEVAACEAAGIDFEEITVANDGLSVVVNPKNDWAQCLTVEELNAIWAPDSTVDNWSQVRAGFPDVPLQLFGAGTDSGTFDYFTDAINGEEGASRADYAQTEDDNITVQGVSGTPGGLGYFGLSYLEENAGAVRGVAIDGGDGCVEPTTETVQSGEYQPLGRELFVYPSGEALQRPEVIAFLESYIEKNDAITEEALFVPLTGEQRAEAQAKVDSLAGA